LGLSEIFVDEIAKGSGQSVIVLLEKLAAGAWHHKDNIVSKAKLKFNSGFENYLTQTFERCSKTKTIINRSEPVLIRDIHVPLNFGIGDKIFSERAVSDKVLSGQQVVISGIAGSGKSMSMKSMYLQFAQSGSVVPVFAELRHAAEFDGSLTQYITAQIGSFVPSFTESGLKYGLREGLIALVLDGFDEIIRERQEKLEREILDLVREAPMAKVLVSGGRTKGILRGRPFGRLPFKNWISRR
jgi:predicted NACHT family NTPase